VPFRHPLALVEDIVLYEYNGLLASATVRAEAGFSLLLKEKSFGTVVSKPFKHEEALFYRFAKLQNLALSVSVKDDQELLKMQVAELAEQLEDARDDSSDAWELAASVEAELQSAQQEVRNLRARVGFLLSKLTQKPEEVIPIPSTLEDLSDWQEYVAGQVVFAPRALRAATKFVFAEPQLVYRSILLLANEYRSMRLGVSDDARERYQQHLGELKLKDGLSISESRSGEQKDDYFIDHPLHPGKRIMLDHHLRRGTDRDPRNLLRIYFHWDDEEGLVIVGWLPGHLETRQS
jgi:hypothetical protein